MRGGSFHYSHLWSDLSFGCPVSQLVGIVTDFLPPNSAIKITINNAMNIIVGIVTGVIQDANNNSYDRVVIVYAFLAACSSIVAVCNIVFSFFKPDLGRLQWSRKARIRNGEVINELKEKFQENERGGRNRKISLICFSAMVLLVLGSWAAYFWGLATDHNY